MSKTSTVSIPETIPAMTPVRSRERIEVVDILRGFSILHLFNSTGVSTAKFIWDEAERDFYLPTDTADCLDLDRLAFSGEILTLTASWLASQ